MADITTGELEEITCLSNVLRSLMVMAVEPSVAAVVIEEELGFETFLNLGLPPFGLGGRVRQFSRIWP